MFFRLLQRTVLRLESQTERALKRLRDHRRDVLYQNWRRDGEDGDELDLLDRDHAGT